MLNNKKKQSLWLSLFALLFLWHGVCNAGFVDCTANFSVPSQSGQTQIYDIVKQKTVVFGKITVAPDAGYVIKKIEIGDIPAGLTQKPALDPTNNSNMNFMLPASTPAGTYCFTLKGTCARESKGGGGGNEPPPADVPWSVSAKLVIGTVCNNTASKEEKREVKPDVSEEEWPLLPPYVINVPTGSPHRLSEVIAQMNALFKKIADRNKFTIDEGEFGKYLWTPGFTGPGKQKVENGEAICPICHQPWNMVTVYAEPPLNFALTYYIAVPSWPQGEAALKKPLLKDCKAIQWWNDFIRTLTAHENGHHKVTTDYIDKFIKPVLNGAATKFVEYGHDPKIAEKNAVDKYKAAIKAAQAQGKTLINGLDAAQKAYDDKTSHGATQNQWVPPGENIPPYDGMWPLF
jgi:hypothetical protein